MHYLSAIYIALFSFVALIVEGNVPTIQYGSYNFTLDCSKFKRDLDIIRSFSYPVQLNPLIKTGKTYAIMNSASQIEELSIYHQVNLPVDVFCLVNLHTLRVNSTPFVSRYEIDDETIATGLSPLISRLTKLRVLSLINITVSHIPAQALSVLTNLSILEVDNCGLREIPSTVSVLTNLEELRLPKNNLHLMPPNNALKKWSKLVHLDMSHNKLRDISELADIASRMVGVMDFSYNEIDYIPPEISQFYYQLYYLYLNDNKLNYIPTDIFALRYLRKIDLQRNPFPPEEVATIKTRFRSNIQNCVILI